MPEKMLLQIDEKIAAYVRLRGNYLKQLILWKGFEEIRMLSILHLSRIFSLQ